MLRMQIAFLGLVFVGCGSSMKSVEMKGSDQDLMGLAGDWEGDYEVLGEGSRTGKIHFTLDSGRHTAKGEVLMYAEGSEDKPQPLNVSFVRAESGEVNGKLDPYLDPACQCQALTTFTGSRVGDVISGTFTVELVTLKMTRNGTWRVARKD